MKSRFLYVKAKQILKPTSYKLDDHTVYQTSKIISESERGEYFSYADARCDLGADQGKLRQMAILVLNSILSNCTTFVMVSALSSALNVNECLMGWGPGESEDALNTYPLGT